MLIGIFNGFFLKAQLLVVKTHKAIDRKVSQSELKTYTENTITNRNIFNRLKIKLQDNKSYKILDLRFYC